MNSTNKNMKKQYFRIDKQTHFWKSQVKFPYFESCPFNEHMFGAHYSCINIAVISYGHRTDKANAQARKHKEQSEFHFDFGIFPVMNDCKNTVYGS